MRAILHPESPASRRQKTGVRPILNAHWHEQQPFNLPNPESAGKIISSSSLLGNSHCLERGCNRARQSPKNFPTDKIFLPQIPRLGTEVFHPFNSHRPARPGPAQLNRFPINKTADRGQEDCMGRNISQAAGRRDQNPSILPPKGGTTHSKKSVSEKFSYQQNFPTPNSEARGRGLPPVQCPPPGTARPSSTIFPINKTAGSGQEDFGVLAASDG